MRLSDAVMDSLGVLENRVLDEIRQLGETNVTGVCQRLGDVYAYTTVMTTLDRLYKKDLLFRRKEGRAYFYKAKYSAEEMEMHLTEDAIARLMETVTGGVEPLLACIIDSVSDRDRELLDELERLIKQKRQEIEREGR